MNKHTVLRHHGEQKYMAPVNAKNCVLRSRDHRRDILRVSSLECVGDSMRRERHRKYTSGTLETHLAELIQEWLKNSSRQGARVVLLQEHIAANKQKMKHA